MELTRATTLIRSRTGRLLSAKLMAASSQFAVGIAIAAVLGPAAKGQVSYAIGTGTLIAIAANGSLFVGASNLGTRGAVHAVRWSDRLVLGIAAFLGMIGVVMVGLGYSIGPLNGAILLLMLVGSGVVALNTFRTRALQALGDSAGFARVTIGQSFMYVAAAGACLILFPDPVLLLVGAWVVAAASASVASRRLTLRRLSDLVPTERGVLDKAANWRREVLRGSLAAHAANVGQHIAYRGDLVILGFLVQPGPIGQYAVATSLMESIWLIAEALALRVYDRSTDSGTPGLSHIRARSLARLGDWISGGLACAIAGMTWAAQPVLLPAYGQVPFLTLILAPGIVLGTRLRINIAQLAVADSRASSVLMGIAGSASIATYVAFIDLWGVAGAAAASSCNYFALSVGSQTLLRRAHAKCAT